MLKMNTGQLHQVQRSRVQKCVPLGKQPTIEINQSHRYQAHRVRHGSECSLGKYCNALQLTAVRISVRQLEICEKRNFARIFHLNAGLQRYSAPHFFGLPY